MKGFWGWLNKVIKDTVSAVTQFVSILPPVSPVDLIIQGCDGATLPLKYNNLPKLEKAPQTRSILKQSANTNLLNFALIIFSYQLLMNLLQYTLVDEEDKESSFSYYVGMQLNLIDTVINYAFLPWAGKKVLDNILLSYGLTQAISKEGNIQPWTDSCHNCSFKARNFAGIGGVGYYLLNLSSVKLTSRLLPYGDYLTWPIFALVVGLSIVEGRLDVEKVCTDHRAKEYLSKNKFYAFTVGSTLLLVQKGICVVIELATGVRNEYINFALFNFLTHYFSAHAMLNDAKWPGKERGTDVFYPSRWVLQTVARNGMRLIIKELKTPDGNPWITWDEVKEFCQNAKNKRAVKYLAGLLSYQFLDPILPEKWQRKHYYVDPVMILFFSICYDDFKSKIKNIETVKKAPGVSYIPLVIDCLPRTVVSLFASEKLIQLVHLLFNDKLELMIADLDKWLDHVKATQDKALKLPSKPRANTPGVHIEKGGFVIIPHPNPATPIPTPIPTPALATPTPVMFIQAEKKALMPQEECFSAVASVSLRTEVNPQRKFVISNKASKAKFFKTKGSVIVARSETQQSNESKKPAPNRGLKLTSGND